MEVTWVDPTWGQWTELTESTEYKTLMGKAQEKLDKGSGNNKKGQGKGNENGAHDGTAKAPSVEYALV